MTWDEPRGSKPTGHGVVPHRHLPSRLPGFASSRSPIPCSPPAAGPAVTQEAQPAGLWINRETIGVCGAAHGGGGCGLTRPPPPLGTELFQLPSPRGRLGSCPVCGTAESAANIPLQQPLSIPSLRS